MLVALRFLLPLMVVLTILYVAISIYSRRVRRGKLEAHWDERGMTGDREDYIEQGLKDYDSSLRRKLILGVYVVPLTVIALLIYVSNFM